MRACILAIGDELLLGDTVNTNASYLGMKLSQKGIEVIRHFVVPDDLGAIKDIIRDSKALSDLTLITGGLGPTHDDVTKKAVCEYFGVGLKRDEESLKRNRDFFQQRGIPFGISNEAQSDVPENAQVLQNKMGTAQGMWIEQDNHILVVMPGVPREMKYLMEQEVIPRLQQGRFVYTHYLKTMGIGESTLSDLLHPEVSEYLDRGLKLAFLPQTFGVNLRVMSAGASEEEARSKALPMIAQIRKTAGIHIYSEQISESIQEALGRILKDKGLSLTVAESCTAGMLGSALADVPGSSEYFLGGVISYSNALKMSLLGVQQHTLDLHGAVSRETACEMASGARKKLHSDIALSVTGVAGPGGGTDEKPVGTVWFGLSSEEQSYAWKAQFGRSRQQNRERSVLMALEVLRRHLLGIQELPFNAKRMDC